MKRSIVIVLLAAAAAGTFAPAGAAPVAGASLSRNVNGYAQKIIQIGNNLISIEAWNISIYTNRQATSTSLPTIAETYTASVNFFGCTNNCSTQLFWNAWTSTLPANALQMDPLANSATIQMTLTDDQQIPESHTFNLTLTRPQQSWESHGFPNAWIDGTSAGAGAPYISFSRSGYVINGTIDNGTLANTPPGPCNGLCGYSSANIAQTLDYASVTVS